MTFIVDMPIGGHARCPCGTFLGEGAKHDPNCEDSYTPELSRWKPLTGRERFRLLPGVHDLWFVLTYWTGVRNRMRCPKCHAVGTWKMHGSLLERKIFGDIAVRRCLCKWCGYYTGPRGRVTAYPDMVETSAWALPEPGKDRQPTPMEAIKDSLGNVWPWVG